MTHREINRKIASILDEPMSYDVRRELRMEDFGLTLEEAEAFINEAPASDRHLWTITTGRAANYCEHIEIALQAAKRIAERNNQTFVLSLEDGTWKAAYGDYGNCAEYSGGNPAYVTCMVILKFMGKV